MKSVQIRSHFRSVFSCIRTEYGDFRSKARPATLLKKRLWHGCFPVNFAKFLRTPFLQNTSGRLLLRNEASGEDLKIFGSLTSLMHTIEAYLLPWLLLKYFISNNLACKSMLIPNLRVSTTVLNPVDIFVGGAS